MNKSKIKLIISEIARKNGISENEVRNEIQKAVDEAMLNSMVSTDPETKLLWEKMLRNNKKPSPEEFFEFLLGEVNCKKMYE